MVKWQPHGQRITGLMIKYPHIKKNAQQFYCSALPGSVNTPYDCCAKTVWIPGLCAVCVHTWPHSVRGQSCTCCEGPPLSLSSGLHRPEIQHTHICCVPAVDCWPIPVFLRLKIFAQRIPFRAVWRHVRSYYMYYGLLVILVLTGFSD